MLSWLHCFSLYAAVITSKYPHKARELWVYQATMVAEQRRCGGRGWLLYDAEVSGSCRLLKDQPICLNYHVPSVLCERPVLPPLSCVRPRAGRLCPAPTTSCPGGAVQGDGIRSAGGLEAEDLGTPQEEAQKRGMFCLE